MSKTKANETVKRIVYTKVWIDVMTDLFGEGVRDVFIPYKELNVSDTRKELFYKAPYILEVAATAEVPECLTLTLFEKALDLCVNGTKEERIDLEGLLIASEGDALCSMLEAMNLPSKFGVCSYDMHPCVKFGEKMQEYMVRTGLVKIDK